MAAACGIGMTLYTSLFGGRERARVGASKNRPRWVAQGVPIVMG
jgi:hypothetical protein